MGIGASALPAGTAAASGAVWQFLTHTTPFWHRRQQAEPAKPSNDALHGHSLPVAASLDAHRLKYHGSIRLGAGDCGSGAGDCGSDVTGELCAGVCSASGVFEFRFAPVGVTTPVGVTEPMSIPSTAISNWRMSRASSCTPELSSLITTCSSPSFRITGSERLAFASGETATFGTLPLTSAAAAASTALATLDPDDDMEAGSDGAAGVPGGRPGDTGCSNGWADGNPPHTSSSVTRCGAGVGASCT
jgi:hypothetical protein